ncbi:MAG: response regulator transcription factor [Nevskiaceae bacterium]|nr:MAG: response regulator transcription factor [Nevskiaceae bacterium]
MRVVIVDDEPLARERLRRLLAEFPGYEIVGEAGDGESALDVIDEEEPDLVLMDIRMGGMDGLQVGRQLAELETPPAVIFTTAYSEHALSAYDAAAQGYLLKPVRLEKLKDALMRVRKPTRAQRPAAAAPTAQGRPKREFVLATTRDGLVRVPVEDIVYFLADQKYTTVCHLHGEVLIEESLKTLEEDFAPWFLRIHRKALVATRFIASLERDRGGEQHHWLKMKHATQALPVSRRRLAEVRRFLTEA